MTTTTVAATSPTGGTGPNFTDGITFRYSADGKDTEDVVTGSIKWVKEKDYDTSGKSYYEFNLRFNEDKNKTPSNEAAAFAKMSDEEAFFAVDNSVPTLIPSSISHKFK